MASRSIREVVAAAPFVQAQAMLTRRAARARGVAVRGIAARRPRSKVADFAQHMVQRRALDALQPGAFGIVLGVDLARALRRACRRQGGADRAAGRRSRPPA